LEIASNVELHRKLRQTVRVSNRVRICVALIGNAEYQRFINAQLVLGVHMQPDHWTRTRFPTGSAREPVQGLRLRDALDFADWVTRATGQRWRLPTRQENLEAPIADASVWCVEEGSAWLSFSADARRTGRWDIGAALELDAGSARLLQAVVGGDFPLDLAGIISLSTERDLNRSPESALRALMGTSGPTRTVPRGLVEQQLEVWGTRLDTIADQAKHRYRFLEPALKLVQGAALLEMRNAARNFLAQLVLAAVSERKENFQGADGARERLNDALLALQHVKSLDLPCAIRNGTIRLVQET
jgi:hypothetical protein